MRRRLPLRTPSQASVYPDASVVSALFDNANPERQELTRLFFERAWSFRVIISEVTAAEIDQTPDAALRSRMKDTVAGFAVLPLTSGAERLADEYVRHGAVPAAQ